MNLETLTRREFCQHLGHGTLLLLFPGIVSRSKMTSDIPTNPNIIILMADDMGYGDVGVYGAQQIPTPNMDSIARQGIRFVDAHSPGPTCTPTRYGILTGRYYWRSLKGSTGHYGYAGSRLDDEMVTLPEFLHSRGYRTGCIGKWHLGLDWGLEKGADKVGENGENIDFRKPIQGGPLDHGFDYYFGIPASLDMPPYCFIENKHTVDIPSVEKMPKNTLQWDRNGLMTPDWRDEQVGPELTKRAKEFIRNHVSNYPSSPFFLYFAGSAPHTPCVPPDFIEGRSSAGDRGDMVAEFDWTVGEISALLDELDLTENTLLIITSDNGALTTGPARWAEEPPENYDIDHRGHKPNDGFRGQKADIYEGAHRVPFLVRWPGKTPPDTVSEEVICFTDFYATFAAINGAVVPQGEAEDSFNVLPAFQGQEIEDHPHLHRSRTGLYAIRLGPWKLIQGRGSGGFTQPVDPPIKEGDLEGQLYHLKSDPGEEENLWAEEPEIVRKLSRMLEIYRNSGRSRR